MKKYFVNQVGMSNKFWNIETEGMTQIVTFGKINTPGREVVKVFLTAKECETETKKLILSKVSRGYFEIKESEDIPEKIEMTDEEAEKLFFWNPIDKSNKHKNSHWSEYDIDEHLENLTELLSGNSKQKLILFEKYLQQNLHKLYTAELAELAVILECDFKKEKGQIIFDDYLSGDGFIYFRCWILLQGKEFFDDISKDINAFVSGKYGFDIADTWAEGLLYVADEAYSVNHENEEDSEISDAVAEMFPDVMHYDSSERIMNRERKGGAKLQKMYPKLVEEIVKLKTEKD